MATEDTTVEGDSSAGDDYDVPEFVDWLAAALVAIAGLGMAVGGSALTFVVDRELLDESIESGELTVIVFERELTQAEALEFSLDVVFWTGIGLLVTGVGLVVFAVGYVVARHRAHRRAADEGTGTAGSSLASAVLGAVATTVLSFIPLSPALGGGVAGYLEHHGRGRSTGVGALSGFLAMLPGLVILVFVTAGLFAGLSGIGETGLGIVTATAMLLVLVFVAAYGAGLGALGGYGGGRLADEE